MKISSIEVVHYDEPIPVYDVINANPYNNFLIKTSLTSDEYIVSHNC